ncbi:alpha/beta hydrolase [Nocardiopsis suaedae]|uniref:Alpha/beta fold hydrolase n=1 Tax=Nocardiopsis suaedae TaxID=3018444 RepID=A0ABT4TKJ3_9ACTN|nr:alpha/beta hydrolase [Nocardiopsis suaedae]MDA2805185.1 alpha/beta fold hydrolase [Nocardiopsis suaedae]
MSTGPNRRPRRRRTLTALKVLAVLVAAWLAIDKAAGIVAPEPQVGHWRSQEGYDSYRAAYDAVMEDLPEPTRTHDVRTGFGTVRVYEWAAGKDAADGRLPAVLLPGISSGAPMWGDNLPSWIGGRTLYAMDAIGDSGMSTQSVPFASFADRAEWVEQMLAGLDIDRAHMVGHSFGGAVAATHALDRPGRVASLTLLEPVVVLEALPVSVYLWSSLLILPAPQPWKDRALAEIGGTTVEEVRERTPMSVMVDEGAEHYAAPTQVPRTFTDDEWRSMEMPVRVDIAAEKSLAGGGEAVDRARSLGMAPVTVWPETTHSLPMQAAEELGPELEGYWSTHDG